MYYNSLLCSALLNESVEVGDWEMSIFLENDYLLYDFNKKYKCYKCTSRTVETSIKS